MRARRHRSTPNMGVVLADDVVRTAVLADGQVGRHRNLEPRGPTAGGAERLRDGRKVPLVHMGEAKGHATTNDAAREPERARPPKPLA